jgi:signal transduction histidine kinase/CheY-like chemotaxis protein
VDTSDPQPLRGASPTGRRSLRPASIETKILAVFAGSLMLLVIAGGFAFRTHTEFADTIQWVAHTQQVRVALGEVYATISDAEAAQRNFILTGNAEHKKDYLRFASALSGEEANLGRLVSDNAVQLKTMEELRAFIVARMSVLSEHLAIFEAEDMAAVREAIANDYGIQAKREVRRLIERMDNAEKDLLAQRQARLESSRNLTFVTLLATLGLSAAILLGLYLGIRRQIAARAEAETAVVAAREAADSANRAKSTFLATMSHEIRTPMNGVLGMLELLSLTKLEPAQRTTLEIVRESSKSLLRIIDDILDFSKIEAGKLEVRPGVVSIRSVIEDVHNIYSGNASSKGLVIRRVADPKISPAVLVDQLRLRQILNNFVSNALKFTLRGSIEIKAELVGRANGEDQVRFSVTDTGSGISAENQERLFQPFSQGDHPAARADGTGLGLTICRRLAGMMGGTVELVSELGKGTKMILVLSMPIADPNDLAKPEPDSARDLLSAATEGRRPAPTVAEAELEGTLALLVDDHPTNRALLMRQVNALGYAAESAEDGVQALEKWKSGRFAIVITDCNMPLMDGYELVRRIRVFEAASGARHTPVIACTANALAGEAEICFAAGMDDYLVKPVELSQISRKLDLWLPFHAAVERSALAAISGGSAATERDILLDFRRVNDEDTAMLMQGVATTDMAQVARAAHRILGASRMVGALALAAVCERIQGASRASDWAGITASMDAFNLESLRLNAYCDSL